MLVANLIHPGFAHQLFAASSWPRGEVGEEVEFGVSNDLGMKLQELFEFGIVAGDVVLVGEQGGVAGDDLGEGGAHAEEDEKLLAELGEIVVAGRGAGLGVDLCGS